MKPEEKLAHDYAKNMAIYNDIQYMNVYGRTVDELATIKLKQEETLANAMKADADLKEILKNQSYQASSMEKTAEELGTTLMAAQSAIHTVPAGWPLSSALAEFGHIMESWAQHPTGRNWDVVSKIESFIKEIERKNAINKDNI